MCYNFNFNNYVGLSIEIQVNGTATTRTQFCVGELLTFVCRPVTSTFGIYAWEIPSVVAGHDLLVSRGTPTNSFNNFNVTLVSDTEVTLVLEVSMNLK